MAPPPTSRSGALCSKRCWLIASERAGVSISLQIQTGLSGVLRVLGVVRIDQLAAHQVERRFPVEHDVVERIGEDLREPHQAGLHTLEEEQVDGAEQKARDAKT